MGIAICPKLPDPPGINTVCPAFASNSSCNPWYAVKPVNGTATASLKSRFLGIWLIASALTATYSANAPILSIGRREYILSPFLNLVTLFPTSSIIPDNSFPNVSGIL